MKRIAKTTVLTLAMALSLSLGAGITADAAKKPIVKKVVSVNSLTGKKTITLAKGKKATLKTTVTVSPNKNANKKVTYKTSNKKVATVSKKGVIKAKKAGKATISVTSVKKNKKNKKVTAKVTVKVVTGQVKTLSVDKTSVELKKGDSETITPSFTTKGKKANKTLLWTSSDEKIATVTQTGVITAVAPGTAKVTAVTTDGTNKKVTVDVKVVTTTLELGKKAITAEVTLDNASKMKDDFTKLVGALGLKDTETVELTIDDAKTATKKTVAEAKKFFENNKKDSVTVKVTASNEQASKLGLAGTLFTPASVKSVKVGDVTFTNIKADSFKIGDKVYTYTVDGKKLVVDGHVAKDFEALTKSGVEIITATEN